MQTRQLEDSIIDRASFSLFTDYVLCTVYSSYSRLATDDLLCTQYAEPQSAE